MTKGQRRLAAIVLALLGIYGTMAALEDRVAEKEVAAQTTASIEYATEVETTASK